MVLERGEIANSWRHERWDSLRLLTPNWQSRLPGYRYAGDDPDGFMSMPEVIQFIARYAGFIGAPVRTDTTVTSVRQDGDGFRVMTDQREWRCRAVVMASGAHGIPNVPALAATTADYRALSDRRRNIRNPGQLDDAGVLIVGASATGLQLADEIHASGRAVTLAVGEHIRHAAHLSRPRHPVVAGRRGNPRSALRRGRRPGQGAAHAFAAARRHAASAPRST